MVNDTWRFEPESATILIIDNESANLKLLQKMLTSFGYHDLVLVQDSREALELYKRKKPHLVLLDLNMPHIDGFGVLKQLSELNEIAAAPVIVITAQSGFDSKLRSLNEGARDFISKPFNRFELEARVKNLLDAHLAHRMIHDQNSVLEGLVKQRTKELMDTRLQVIERLSRAAEYRDNETGEHIQRMSRYSQTIASYLGLSESECDRILHASPMHDIGKIGIPDHILLKQGPLSDDEFEIIKTHSVIGAEILSEDGSELMIMARDIALYHHEKWDGSGYPYGVSGEEIPIAARIVAIADVFDALMTERPYKKPWSLDDALALIVKSSGSHFDPKVVDAFMAVLPDILEIRERYKEDKTGLSRDTFTCGMDD